ncbi:hypothetical protein SKAU_G00273130 [Synaphobranchus kaupii]|uniref:Uncharacterized protein n=1 Tax=Synaphobranchus kaupii TaxID=118154 RepID=A0A9Q1F0Z4_SYNKA|nr:hypothetical protein SKAU_G00273130 [Synaphobranchus kaupii]
MQRSRRCVSAVPVRKPRGNEDAGISRPATERPSVCVFRGGLGDASREARLWRPSVPPFSPAPRVPVLLFAARVRPGDAQAPARSGFRDAPRF